MTLIALIGRANVGKSTLFNRLTASRSALVSGRPGLTRDRKYGKGAVGSMPYTLIDCAGIDDEDSEISIRASEQAWRAVDEAELVFFIVDGRQPPNVLDEKIAQVLHKSGKKTILVANKAEGVEPAHFATEYFSLGFGKPQTVSALHNQRIQTLMKFALQDFNRSLPKEEPEEKAIRIAIAGRPNTGKSTFINTLVGEERLLSLDVPGTTRDSIEVPWQMGDAKLVLIDTAGVRRRARVKDTVEKFSIAKSLEAIKAGEVVILLLDADEGLTGQDLNLLSSVIASGKPFVLALNKSDKLSGDYKKNMLNRRLEKKLRFINQAQIIQVSARQGTGLRTVISAALKLYKKSSLSFPTSLLNKILIEAVGNHPPPAIRGRRIKLKHIHQAGSKPPVFFIYGNKTDEVSAEYKKYLTNFLQAELDIGSVTIKLVFKNSANPFKDHKNPLTTRQKKKKKRLKKYIRHKKR